MSHSVRGVMVSYYNQEIASISLDKEYLYRSYSLSIMQKKQVVGLPFFALTFDLQTQLGMSHLANRREIDFVEKGIEIALLAGLNLEFSLLPDIWWLYAGGSIGPQFISRTPSRQASGFIFSDSIYAGTRLGITRRNQFDIRGGFRHQSNAGFSEPNGGLNSLFIKLGFFSKI